jgi:hypothetical protein
LQRGKGFACHNSGKLAVIDDQNGCCHFLLPLQVDWADRNVRTRHARVSFGFF